MSSYCIPREYLEKFWPHTAPLIRRAIERVGISRFEDVERDLFNNYALLWIHWDGKEIDCAAVTQIGGDVCTVVAVGGKNIKAWIDSEKILGDYAKANGCTRLRGIGRDGWRRYLPAYKRKYFVIERDL